MDSSMDSFYTASNNANAAGMNSGAAYGMRTENGTAPASMAHINVDAAGMNSASAAFINANVTGTGSGREQDVRMETGADSASAVFISADAADTEHGGSGGVIFAAIAAVIAAIVCALLIVRRAQGTAHHAKPTPAPKAEPVCTKKEAEEVLDLIEAIASLYKD